jgi:hypothetical protein
MKFRFLIDVPRSRSIAWRAAVALGLLAVSACGAGSHATATQPSAPTAAAERLFAVVESSTAGSQPDTVAIVGLDGVARAKATFEPRTGPGIPDAYVPLQSVAQVAGSGVYYIDGAGTVRVLREGSQPQVVARFPLQPAQEDVWFAVSPDGSRVVAGILTLPALGPPVSGTSWPTLVGSWNFDLESAQAGGQTKTLVHVGSVNDPDDLVKGWKPTFPAGWNAAGPVAMLPGHVSSQNAWYGGPLFAIDDAGNKTAQLGGSDCNAASMSSSGLIACSSGQYGVTVRDQGGNVIWTTHVEGSLALSLHISPDGQAISNLSQVETHAGGMVPMPTGFRVEGWLDSNTVFGRVTSDANTIGGPNEGNLLWIGLDKPTIVHDLGFEGDFVATLA